LYYNALSLGELLLLTAPICLPACRYLIRYVLQMTKLRDIDAACTFWTPVRYPPDDDLLRPSDTLYLYPFLAPYLHNAFLRTQEAP